ncbi:MAG: formylglycine-generating enzyme family protein [Planctomycetota bacterium]|nr:MAG: formylglycine-generating enzyme family protein [Planctomycetota bacterium]
MAAKKSTIRQPAAAKQRTPAVAKKRTTAAAKPVAAKKRTPAAAKPVASKPAATPKPGPPATNSIGVKLVPIPAGSFMMGSPVSEKDRGTDEGQVRVTITHPYLIGRTVVTKAQWKGVMKSEPWKGERCVATGDDAPAVYVDWHDAESFCRKLTAQERAGGWLAKGEHYRLPTEAEWEYACRAGTTTPFSFGTDSRQLSDHAWFYSNTTGKAHQYAHRVGRKKPNPWGLRDMHGNVYEWCSDWYRSTLGGGDDPRGPASGSAKVLRGGGWGYDPARCRSADRNRNEPSFSDFSGGFRIVLASE